MESESHRGDLVQFNDDILMTTIFGIEIWLTNSFAYNLQERSTTRNKHAGEHLIFVYWLKLVKSVKNNTLITEQYVRFYKVAPPLADQIYVGAGDAPVSHHHLFTTHFPTNTWN